MKIFTILSRLETPYLLMHIIMLQKYSFKAWSVWTTTTAYEISLQGLKLNHLQGTDKSESSDDNDKSTTLSVLWSVLAFQLPPWGANQKSIYTTPLTFTWKCLLLFSNYSQFFILNSLTLLLFSELFRHNYLRPSCSVPTSPLKGNHMILIRALVGVFTAF